MTEVSIMSDDWGQAAEENDRSLKSIPQDWAGYTRAAKVEKLVSVIHYQISKVHRGDFDLSKASKVAALVLDAQMEMSEFFAEAEASSKHLKHDSDYIEAEVITKLGRQFVSENKKVAETSLKRMAMVSEEVKKSKIEMVEAEKEFKKWRHVSEILKDAHHFFKNLGKA